MLKIVHCMFFASFLDIEFLNQLIYLKFSFVADY